MSLWLWICISITTLIVAVFVFLVCGGVNAVRNVAGVDYSPVTKKGNPDVIPTRHRQ